MNTLTLTPALWDAPHFRPINQFYKSQKHKGKANGQDRVFYLHEKTDANTVYGAVRLVPQTEPAEYDATPYYWLRSLYIAENLRGQGWGKQLLAFVHQQLVPRQTIFCFPYRHLESFYGQCGYETVDEADMPISLRDLLLRYTQKGEKILCMRWIPDAPIAFME